MNAIDFGRHSDDYATYRPGFPRSFYRRLEAIIPIEGSRALDLATGPGTIALELGALGATAIGIDTARGQIAAAERLCRERGLDERVRFVVARAEHTGLEAASFDLVTSGQSWHWFDGNAAMAEAMRVLRPAGVLAIAHYSYMPEYSPPARDTEELVLRFNPAWTMAGASGIHPELIDEVIRSGFDLVEQFCYHHDEEFLHVRWRGRMRTCNGVGSGGMSPAEVLQFDDALKELLSRRYPDPIVIPHRVWCVAGRKPVKS